MPKKACERCGGKGFVNTNHGIVPCPNPDCDHGFVEYTPPPKPPKK